MAKNKALITLGIIVGATVLVGVGIVGGKMISKGNSEETKESAISTKDSSKEQAVTSEPAKPVEQPVAKTGVCNAGEVKYIGKGNFVVGTDIASGEYLVQFNPEDGEPPTGLYFSAYVYSSKSNYEVQGYSRSKIAEIMITSRDRKESVKLDEGNYMTIQYGGKMTCQ